MKHKLWAVALASLAIVVVGAVVRPPALESLAQLAPQPNAALAVQQWIQQVTTHLTTTSFVVCAGVAWCIFVLALILLARSKRDMPREQKPQRESTKAATNADAAPTNIAQMPERSGSHDAPVTSLGAGDEVLTPAPTSSPTVTPVTVTPVASDPAVEQRARSESQPVHESGMSDAPRIQPNRGHVLALTGLSLSADGRLLPYGIFVVAEDVETAHGGSQASQRAVEIIAEQVVPSLATQPVPQTKQLTALLNAAIMRVGMEIGCRGSCSTMGLATAIAGVVVHGDMAHVVNVGDCRTYLFRPRTGLVQITSDQGATSDVVEVGPPLKERGSMHAYPPRDEVFRHVRSDTLSTLWDTFEVSVHADDLLLLCSPGLWKALRQQELETILRANIEPPSTAEILAYEGASRAREESMHIIVVRLPRDRMPGFGIPAPRAGLS
jgi:serine/threonine protein phosphatase PrpC